MEQTPIDRMTNLDALYFLQKIERRLLEMRHQIDLNFLKEKHHMLDPSVADVIQKIDTATTGVATRLDALIAKANNAGSLSAAEVVAALQPEVDRLTAMGSDPANPVPAT